MINKKLFLKMKRLFSLSIFQSLLIFILAGCSTYEDTDLVAPTVMEDPTLPSLEVNGTRLHLQTFGDPLNPVIIFLHGGPGGSFADLMRLQPLEDQYFLVFFDQRGSGLSQRHDPDDITLENYIGDLDAIIDLYRRDPTDRVHIFSDSWGGQYITLYIDDDPTRAMSKLNKVVFADPGAFIGSRMDDLPIAEFSLTDEWLNELLWHNEFISPDDHARADYLYVTGSLGAEPNYNKSKTDPAPSFRLGAIASEKIFEIGTNSSGDFDWDWTQNLDQYTNPVTFIRSGLNEINTQQFMETASNDYPNSELLTVAGVGHDGPWVKSAEYITILRSKFVP